MKKYAFFWGCQIPARFPFVELSTRKTLGTLGIAFEDVEGFTCCPQSAAVKPFGETAWLAAAARNLAVAESGGFDILTSCNGCYQVLKTANAKLKTGPQLLDKINKALGAAGMSYSGTVEVRHLLDVLYDEVTPAAIARKIEKPLLGMKVGVHYGCHLLRPSDTLRFDDPLEPAKFEALVNALGAEAADYESKLLCCGGLLSDTGNESGGLELSRKKLAEMKGLGIDAMCLTCPACFIQYDSRQPLLKSKGENIDMTVLFYTELLGLAMGMEPKELGVMKHAVKPRKFLEKWNGNMESLKEVKELFDLPFLTYCAGCRACVEECPAAAVIDGFSPSVIIEKLLDGKIDELVSGSEIWCCLECETCREICPLKIGMSGVISKLKAMAAQKNAVPEGLQRAAKMFRTTGAVAEVIEVSRKRLGLPPSKKGGFEQLKAILDVLGEQE